MEEEIKEEEIEEQLRLIALRHYQKTGIRIEYVSFEWLRISQISGSRYELHKTSVCSEK